MTSSADTTAGSGEWGNGSPGDFDSSSPGSSPGSPVHRRCPLHLESVATAAPTVLILAAGQGTRMRSSTPKVLHELCGIPMLLWPVRAAQAAGGAPGGGGRTGET